MQRGELVSVERRNGTGTSDETIRPDDGLAVSIKRDRWSTTFAVAISAVAVGYAIQVSGGWTMVLLTLALIVGLIGVVAPPVARFEVLGDGPVVLVLGAGLALQLSAILTMLPDRYVALADPAAYAHFFVGMAVGIVIVAMISGDGLSKRPWLGRFWMPIVLLIYFWLGAWMIAHAVQRHIDVYIFQQDASIALLQGHNPFALTFPDIYTPLGLPFYGPGLSEDGRLLFGFPYPPLSLLFVLPGHLIGGDFRFGHLAATTLAGALMAYARPGRLSFGAATLFLFTPRTLHILEAGWTEPLAVCLLAATVFCACRARWALPIALGLFLAVKQYLIFAVPLIVLLVARPLRWADLWDLLWKAGLVALVVTLPFALWNVPAFINSVILVHFRQPFRLDAVSYLSWLARHGGPQLSATVGLVAILPVTALALWRAPRTPAGFAAATALVLFTFFAFNKQAFGNYYYFAVGALCCAVAASYPPAHVSHQSSGTTPRS